MDNDALLAMMKANQHSYLTAYDQGYRKGWDDACAEAMKIFNKPKPKRTYVKKEKSE